MSGLLKSRRVGHTAANISLKTNDDERRLHVSQALVSVESLASKSLSLSSENQDIMQLYQTCLMDLQSHDRRAEEALKTEQMDF